MADLFDRPEHHGGGIGGVHLSDKGPGGIPTWGLVIILAAGGYFAYEWYSNRSTSGSSSGTPTPASSSSSGVAGDSGEESFSYSGPGQYFYPGTPEPVGSTRTPATNTQWERVVEDWLKSKGEQPGDVDDTVADYLDGQNLDREERSMIDLAESVWGAPPQPIDIMPSRKRRRDRREHTGEGGGISDVHGPRTGGSGPPVRRKPIRDKRRESGDDGRSGTRDRKDEDNRRRR